MYLLAMIFADGEPAAAPGPGGGIGSFLFPLILMFGVMYFLMIRPQRKAEAARQALIKALKKGDKVVTSSGIIGTVAEIADKDDEVTLKIDPNANVRMRVLRTSIQRVLNAPTTSTTPTESTPATK